jgi:SAM-dependent methyltransferase
VRLATRICLALGSVGHAVFGFEHPADLVSAAHDDAYFEDEIERGRELVAELPPIEGKRVLEIGCGFGGMLVALADAGADATGVDVDQRRAGYAAARGLDAYVADAEHLPFNGETFDLVVSDSVMEHIPDVPKALQEAHRVLRVGGIFYASWGNSWLTYNGPHLVKALGIPWIHLLFSDRTIVEALEAQKQTGRWPTSYLDYKINDFLSMGRTTRRSLRAAAKGTGLGSRSSQKQAFRHPD